MIPIWPSYAFHPALLLQRQPLSVSGSFFPLTHGAICLLPIMEPFGCQLHLDILVITYFQVEGATSTCLLLFLPKIVFRFSFSYLLAPEVPSSCCSKLALPVHQAR